MKKLLLLMCALQMSAAMAEQTPDSAPNDSSRPLTRIEVRADLNLWRRAGMMQFDLTLFQDIAPVAYQIAWQQYLNLRYGPAYVEEILRLTSEVDW